MKHASHLFLAGLILVGSLLSSAGAMADTPFALEPSGVEAYLRQTQVPETLFHWTTERHLKTLETNRIDDDALGFRSLMGNVPPIVVGTIPDLKYRPGIFTSANPVTGVGYNAGEMYVRNDSTTGSPPLLLVLKMKPGIKRAAVVTNDLTQVPIVLGNPTRADVIHHVYIDNMGVALQEWIILNPLAVESAVADPGVVRPILEEKLQQVKLGLLDNAIVERHSRMSLDEAARAADRVLRAWDANPALLQNAIPSLFRAHSGAGSVNQSYAGAVGLTCPVTFGN